jgi:signal transduction histidine kinase
MPLWDDGSPAGWGYARNVKRGSLRLRWAIDLGICAVLLYAGVDITTNYESSQGAGVDTNVDTLLIPTLILPLLLRHRAPFAAAATFAAACVISGIPTFDQFRVPVAVPAALLIAYSVGREPDRARAIGGLVCVLAGLIAIGLTDPVIDDEGGVIAMVAFAPLCGLLWAAARLVTSGDRLAARLAERSEHLERQREQTAELAVEVERAQLASELDLAARDRVREMIELAEAWARSLATDPEATQTAFGRIERLGRDSLNEMRGLLGLLRSDERGRRSPRPTLAALETLLAEARRGGRVVELHLEGERRPLPGGVELAAYRVLQHALVAVGSEEGEPATVELRYLPGALELEVSGPPGDGTSARAAVLAARERVTSYGGSFSAENSGPGLRVLRAHLPTALAHG